VISFPGFHSSRFGQWAIISLLIGVVLALRWFFGSPSGPEARGTREYRPESLWWPNVENVELISCGLRCPDQVISYPPNSRTGLFVSEHRATLGLFIRRLSTFFFGGDRLPEPLRFPGEIWWRRPTSSRSNVFSDVSIEFAGYSKLGFTSFVPKRESKQDAVLITKRGRFGNSLLQAAYGVHMARKLSSNVLLFSEDWEPRQPTRLPGGMRLMTLGNLEEGTGKNLRRVWLTKAMPAPPAFPSDLADDDIVGLRSFFLETYSFPTVSSMEETLTIHLRSGDVFAEKPHPGYGQSPCAFYAKIIKRLSPRRIVVVAEDALHPCFSPIRQLAEHSGIGFEHVGQVFESAVAHLASSNRIVSSVGTFVPTVCFLFPRAREIYSFARPNLSLYPDSSSTEFVCFDKSGDYLEKVLSFNWSNTQSQIDLMKTYPEDLIADPLALRD